MSASSATLLQRLITQLYFEGDPLIPLCPIVQTIPTPMPSIS
jgi:protocatechuate 3,4-dioxygenase beta subunit